LTSMLAKKKNAYDAAYKMKAIEHVEKRTNREAARKFKFQRVE